MRLNRNILLKLRESQLYSRVPLIKCMPMTLEQVINFFSHVEFSDIKIVMRSHGEEIDLFIRDKWEYSIVRCGDIFYVCPIGLKFEDWLVLTPLSKWPFSTVGALLVWFWEYHISKYGKLKGSLIVFYPIIAWFLSGIIPVIFLKPRVLISSPLLTIILALYLGILASYCFTAITGLIISVFLLIIQIILYWRFLWREK